MVEDEGEREEAEEEGSWEKELRRPAMGGLGGRGGEGRGGEGIQTDGDGHTTKLHSRQSEDEARWLCELLASP